MAVLTPLFTRLSYISTNDVCVSTNDVCISTNDVCACREKFQELVAKEQDLSNFMDGFPGRKAAKIEEMRTRQDAIVGQLEKINKLMVRCGGVKEDSRRSCERMP